MKVLAVVGRRLRHLVGLVEAMTFGSVTQRLARLLLDASKGAGSEAFDLPVTHQEIAGTRAGHACVCERLVHLDELQVALQFLNFCLDARLIAR